MKHSTDDVCNQCGCDFNRCRCDDWAKHYDERAEKIPMDRITISTEDGYKFRRQPNGDWGDGDMGWRSLGEMFTDFERDGIRHWIAVDEMEPIEIW